MMKSTVKRVLISALPDFWKKLDKRMKLAGYENRSEFMRECVEQAIVKPIKEKQPEEKKVDFL